VGEGNAFQETTVSKVINQGRELLPSEGVCTREEEYRSNNKKIKIQLKKLRNNGRKKKSVMHSEK